MDYKVGINALCYSTNRAGISNYIYNLLQQLSKQSHNVQFTVFLPQSAKKDYVKFDNCKMVFLPAKNILFRILLEQLFLPILFYRFKLDLLHSPGNISPILLFKKNIVTIHDIYFRHDKNRFTLFKKVYLYLFTPLTVRFCRSVICVSRYTYLEILKYYKVDQSKITVIAQGYSVGSTTSTAIKPVFNNSIISKPFFLFVGTIEPGKNLVNLIKAFKSFQSQYQLIIAGKFGWKYEVIITAANEVSVKDAIIFTGYISDSNLTWLYDNAKALVFPSIYEGFGLPVIEAMSRGCPVCCSDTSCLPETAGNAALYFDPLKPSDINEKMKTVLDPVVRKDLKKKGYLNVKRFSWEHSASVLLNHYFEVLKNR
ncbi:glycosyltransferase family 1 protein [Chitinispirillales bacterium ANBcel5]|uniref:glycosyltransferase family 4 protein n=1 Tax=Cellulosispirillum alkaliphilum TaxID=3039283 RepID=UPI002A5236C2|nr:glycosyltransferase family 1 protein [Chitinispirillales bacterium ANBcel5]